jgi:nitrate reductase beta subunit
VLANYGFEDGTGSYYISINESICAECLGKKCVEGCAPKVLEKRLNDFDDEIVVVKEDVCHMIQFTCGDCHLQARPLPCELACGKGAVRFSW